MTVQESAAVSRVVIRRAALNERDAAQALAHTVACEVFGNDLVPHDSFSEEDWSLSWLAISEDKMTGVVLTHGEWIGDLWVLGEYRGRGIGRALLLQGEAEIAARGHQTFRLRVVKSNIQAVDFYRHLGWQIEREFPHETLPTIMLEMSKWAPSRARRWPL